MKSDVFYEEYALICKTIVNPIRIQIIEVIGKEKLNVSDIQTQLNISKSNLSNHLSALHRIGVLGREKKGNYIFYYLMEFELLDVLQGMKRVVYSIASKRNQLMSESKILSKTFKD